MEVLGIIPARGGSKAIPHKNIALLGGRPLLAYTCDAARSSRRLSRLILDTDDPEIAAAGQACSVDAPYLRPPELARDDTPIVPVIQHALRWLQEREGYTPEAVVLLQPTSPLRRAEDIDAAVELLEASGADTVVSVVAVPHQYNPVSVMRLEPDGRLVPFLEGPLVLRRQAKPRVYARNGPAVLAVRRATIEQGLLYGEHVRPYEMGRIESLDIDDPLDLELAEFYLQRLKSASGS